jgi:hypothetical protein
VLVYAKEELVEEKKSKSNNAARFKGLLTDQEAVKYHSYLKKARSIQSQYLPRPAKSH